MDVISLGPIVIIALIAFGVLMVGIVIAAVVAVLVGRSSSK